MYCNKTEFRAGRFKGQFPRCAPASKRVGSSSPSFSSNDEISFFTDTAITPEYPVLATESPNYIAGNTSFCLASTAHIIRHRELFTTYDDSSHERIIGSTGHTLDAQGRGSVRIAVTLHGTRKFITLSECLHVPAASTNIVSLPKWLEKGGEFVGKGESITLKFKSRVYATANKSSNGLFFLREATPQ